MNNKPIDQLFAGIDTGNGASVDDLAQLNAPKLIAPRPPINLPLFTFLVGEKEKCDALAKALGEQSAMVFIDDFKSPVYDAVSALFGLPMTVDVSDGETQKKPAPFVHGDMPFGYYCDALFKCLNSIRWQEMLLARAKDSMSFADYQFVIRDAAGFDLTLFEKEFGKNRMIVLHLNGGQDGNIDGTNIYFHPTAEVNIILENLAISLV